MTDVPIRVVAASPTGESVGVARHSAITVTFSEKLTADSVADAFKLESLGYPDSSAAAQAVEFTAAYAETSVPTVTLTPKAPFAFSTIYRVTIATTLKRARDNGPLPVVVTWKFQTADPPALLVQRIEPADGATGVAREAVVKVTFSEPVNCDTLKNGNAALAETYDLHPHTSAGGPVKEVAGTWDCPVVDPAADETLDGLWCASDPTKCVVTFKPDDPKFLARFSSHLKLTLKGGKDADKPVASARATPFGGQLPTTVESGWRAIDPAALSVSATAPGASAGQVPRDATVTLNFSEPIDCATLSADLVQLKQTYDLHPRLGAKAGTIEDVPGTWACTAAAPEEQAPGTCATKPELCRAVFTPAAGFLFEWSSGITVTLAGGLYTPDVVPAKIASVESARATTHDGQLHETIAISFRVVDPPPIALINVSPGDNSTGVGRSPVLYAAFSEPPRCATLSDTLITLVSATEDAHPRLAGKASPREIGGTWTCPAPSATDPYTCVPGANDPCIVTFTPSAGQVPLDASTAVDLVLKGGAYAAGQPLTASKYLESTRATTRGGELPVDVDVQFRVEDPVPQLVTATSPGNGAKGVSAQAPVPVEVSVAQPLACATVNGTTVTTSVVRADGTTMAYPYTVSCADGDKKFVLNPAAGSLLAYSATVTVHIAGGTFAGSAHGAYPDDALESNDATTRGGQLAADYSFSFRTEDPPPLRVVETTPGEGATGAPATGPISVKFSEAVDCATVTAAAITISEKTDAGATSTVAAAVTSCAGDTATFTPASIFAEGSTVTVQLAATIASARATSSGGNLVGGYSFSYRVADPPPLAVIAQLPSSNAVNVDGAMSPTVQVIFSAPLNAASVTTASFFLNEGLVSNPATAVAATVTIPVPSKAALQSAAILKYDTDYTVTLKGCAAPPCALGIAAAVATSRGGWLPTDVVYSFRTVKIPPQVVSTDPANGATGIDPNLPVKITFSQNMASASVENLANVFVSAGVGTTGPAVPGTLTYNPATLTVTFAPTASFNFNADYTINVTTNATNTAGVGLPTAFQAGFHTRVNNFILSTLPADGAVGVPINTAIVVTFTTAMDPTTITATSFSVTFTDQFGVVRVVPGNIAMSAGNTVATFTPSSAAANCDPYSRPLRYGTQYTVTLGTAIKTGGGTAMPAPYVFKFTTAAPPLIASTNPAAGETDVAVVIAGVEVTFSRAMDPATVTTSTLLLNEVGSGTAVAGTVSLDAAKTKASFKPGAALKYNTAYKATVVSGLTGVRDAAGNFIDPPDYTFTFTTSPANVVRIVPTSAGCYLGGSYGVCSNNITVAATFSRAIDPLTVNDVSFSVVNGATRKNTGLIAVGGDRKSVIFIPAPVFPAGTETVTATTDIKDYRGNPLSANAVGTFANSGGADQNVPTVGGVAPANNSTVSGDAAFVINFPCDIHPTTLNDRTVTLTAFGSTVPLPSTVTYDIPGHTATVTPTSYLRAATAPYTLTVTTNVTNLQLIGLAGSVPFSFNVEGIVPTVSGVVPANAATQVVPTASVVVTMSENIDPASVTPTTVTVASGANVAGTLSVAGNVITFKPLTRLPGNKTYTVTVRGGPGGVTDVAGNALAANFTSTFTTDSISPTVVSSVPAINATLVNPAAPLSLTFSEPIDPASVTYSTTISTGSVSLAAGAAQVFGCFSFNPTSTVVTFTPLAPLTAATGHSFSASAGVTDLGGLALTPYTAPFTTQ